MSLFPDFHVLMSVQNRVTDCDITHSLSLFLSFLATNYPSLPLLISLFSGSVSQSSSLVEN